MPPTAVSRQRKEPKRSNSQSKSCALWLVLTGMLCCMASCLKLNPDHDFFQRSQDANNPDAPDPSSTIDDLENPSNAVNTSSEQGPESPTDLPDAEISSSSSSTTGSPQDSTSSQSSTTDPTNTTSISGTTDSTGTYLPPFPPPNPIDIDFSDGTWRELEVSLSSAASTTADTGYSMQLYFDHSNFVQNGANANGDDLAVVFVENAKGYAIDRILDPGYRWNHTATRIWFPLQQPLAPGQSVGGKYYLVYGSTQFTAQSSAERVFLTYDDFQNAQLDANKWTIEQQGLGTSNVAFDSVGVQLSAESSSEALEAASLKSRWNGSFNGILAEVRLRFPNSVNQSCNQMMPLAFETSADNRVAHGLSLRAGDWLHTYASPNASNLEYWLVSSLTHTADWSRYAIGWYETTHRAWRDTTEHVNRSSQSLSTPRPDTQNLHLRLQSGAGIGSCVGSSASRVDIDWVWVRRFQLPEPQTVLK